VIVPMGQPTSPNDSQHEGVDGGKGDPIAGAFALFAGSCTG
jgi:hypothetical protein